MRHPGDRRILIRAAVGLIALIALVVAAYFIARNAEENAAVQERGVMSEGFGQMPTVEYQGRKYRLKDSVENILLIGTDLEEGAERTGYRSNGQADFLLLLSVSHREKRITVLQIDRDTIADVTMLGVLGNVTGTRRVQISLAHSFGAEEKDGCELTAGAVERLLQGVKINGCISMSLNTIGALNHALGGVTVTIEDDFTAYDSAMAPGAVIRLTDEQAELFNHSRMTIGDGTNASRMRRHRAYMEGAISAMREKLARGARQAEELLDGIWDVIYTDMTRSSILNEMNRDYQYEVLPTVTLAGEYQIGKDGFNEFHADEEALLAFVIDTFYTPAD